MRLLSLPHIISGKSPKAERYIQVELMMERMVLLTPHTESQMLVNVNINYQQKAGHVMSGQTLKPYQITNSFCDFLCTLLYALGR